MEKLLKCSTCKEEKPESAFSIDNYSPRGRNYRCKKCISEWKKNPEVRQKLNERESVYRKQGMHKLARRNRRIKAIEKLGGRCECCGESRMEFLAIDHIRELRGIKRNSGFAGDSTALKVLREEAPQETYRVLCHNCNSALGFYGYCPHKIKKDFLNR